MPSLISSLKDFAHRHGPYGQNVKSLQFGGDYGYGSGWEQSNNEHSLTAQIGAALRNFAGTHVDWFREAGDLSLSALIMPVVRWHASALPEAPLQVVETDEDGKRTPIRDHPLPKLLLQPNPFFSDAQFWDAFSLSSVCSGNAYFVKRRNDLGEPIELWWVPPYLMAPYWPAGVTNVFIQKYLYRVQGQAFPIPVEDVLHYREGVDHRNMGRTGMSPIAAGMREIVGDSEWATYQVALAKRSGVPPFLLTPKEKVNMSGFTPEERKRLREEFDDKRGGDNRGKSMLHTVALDVTRMGMNPKELMLGDLRYSGQEIISSLSGLPGEVLNFGAAARRCLPADTRISTVDRGPVPISEIQIGENVWGLRDGQIQSCAVSHAWKTGRKTVYKVKTRNRTIRASANHPFLTRRREKVPGPGTNHRHSLEWRYWLEWTPLNQLKEGDAIAEILSLPTSNVRTLPDGSMATKSLLQWLGAFLGDGYYTGGLKDIGIGLCIPPADRVRAIYERLTQDVLLRKRALKPRCVSLPIAEDIRERRQRGEFWHDIAAMHGISASGARSAVATLNRYNRAPLEPVTLQHSHERAFAVRSPEHSRWLKTLGFLRGARTKRIPGWVFGLAEDLQLAFLCGLLDTDGSVNRRGHATFRFASKELVKDIWHMALGLGMSVSNIYYVRVPRSALPNKGRQAFYDSWQFTIMSPEDIRRLDSHDPQYRLYLSQTTETKRRKPTRTSANGNYILPPNCAFIFIQKIEAERREDVYDITVEGAHNFVAEGLILANSTFNNMSEANARAYENVLIPEYRRLQRVLDKQLLPDFYPDGVVPPNISCYFDVSKIQALQESVDDYSKRIVDQYYRGVISRAEAKDKLHYPFDLVKDDVYYTDLVQNRFGDSATSVGDGHGNLDATNKAETQSKAKKNQQVSTGSKTQRAANLAKAAKELGIELSFDESVESSNGMSSAKVIW